MGLGLTIPIPGSFGNIRPQVLLEYTADEGENFDDALGDLDKVHRRLHEQAKTLLMRQCLDLGEDMKVILDEGLDSYLTAFFDLKK